ncbi:MAG TPA: DoxX family protein [Gemmatimonadales bacterium]|nr:DoxX family protein [Gemmatimonadales bacterium]
MSIRKLISARPTESQLGIALALLRVVVGVVFVAHGAQKLFVYGPEMVGQGFSQLGLPLPELTAYLVSLAEFGGGMMLVAGILTRLTSAVLLLIMLGAVFVAHLSQGFFMPDGFEFSMVLGAVSAALAIMGAGRYSMDHALTKS